MLRPGHQSQTGWSRRGRLLTYVEFRSEPERFPSADRSRMGIRVPGGDNHDLQLRQRRDLAGQVRPVRPILRGSIPTVACATLRPNRRGLSDMHGNVWEWCGTGMTTSTMRSRPLMDPQGAVRLVPGVPGRWLGLRRQVLPAAYRSRYEPWARAIPGLPLRRQFLSSVVSSVEAPFPSSGA